MCNPLALNALIDLMWSEFQHHSYQTEIFLVMNPMIVESEKIYKIKHIQNIIPKASWILFAISQQGEWNQQLMFPVDCSDLALQSDGGWQTAQKLTQLRFPATAKIVERPCLASILTSEIYPGYLEATLRETASWMPILTLDLEILAGEGQKM